ncbi:uncharacterized protein LOC116773588 [Danaus plexippus]|uniref:uncharacterized protein LOC116773588 n=1 Tax=Danaus plexippus TaxID=13037 RepID=UPI002AAF1B31|nr:uncharacterized protein LOC116773588 [Danaus plexippus]
MHFKLIVLLSLVSFVRNHDVSIGSEGGRKIFEDTRYAGPAIWRQIENITVMAPDNEIISKVNITDLRPDKDGDVKIVDGGSGEKSVTIELKSPTVLRGYEFHIEVYSTPTKTDSNNAQTDIPDGMDKDFKTTEAPESSVSESSEVIPASIGKDSDISRPARETGDIQQTESETEAVNESTPEYTTTTDPEDKSTTEENEGSGGEDSAPIDLDSDLLRPARHASEGDTIEDITTTTEMDYFEIKGTLEYIPTTEETGSENNPTTSTDDVIRPARETDEENESDATTEIVIEDQNMDTAPNNNDINKTNYTNMDILEYIKRKEQGPRQIRRTDDEEDSSDESNENSSESSANYETVDLVPPEENSSYSDNFYSDSTETTMGSVETTLSNNPRYVRRLASDLMFDTTTEAKENTDDVTEGTTMADVVITEAIENTRNSRNTENLLNNEDLDLNNETSADTNIMSNDKITSGIVLLKGNDIIVSAEGKELRFKLPIVLIIGNENNFPLFNMIDSQDMDKRVLNPDSENIMNDNLDENVPEYPSVDAEAASEIIMNDDSY